MAYYLPPPPPSKFRIVVDHDGSQWIHCDVDGQTLRLYCLREKPTKS